MLTIDPKN